LFAPNPLMKNFRTSPRLIAVLAAALFSTQTVPAGTVIWNAASGGNWSVNGNWNVNQAPQSGDDVQFGDVGPGNQNTMDTAFTINSLVYNQDNGLTHTTLLNPALTLSINRGNTGDILNVGSATGATTANTLVTAVVQGPGSTLSLSGTGDIVVRQGNSTGGSHMATLDLSAVDNFNATVGRLLVGQANAGASVNRPSGTLYLAKTNTLTLSGTAPQVMVQDSGSNANGGLASVLYLGQANFFYADQFRLGGQKGNGNVQFNAGFSSPSLVIRNSDQVSRSTQLACGDNSFASSGNSTVANVDLTSGSVDALIDTVYVGRGNPGPGTGTCAGTLGWAAGTFDINTLNIGYQISSGANGAATGSVLVNNNSLVTTNNNIVSTGAVLRVNTTLLLARTNSGGTGAVVGTLNVNGGTVLANSIVAGGGNSSINLTTGGNLVISNSAGTLANPIRNFSISDSTLTLPALNAGAVLAVSNLTAGGVQNIINITAVPPISSYPAAFTLISYRSGTGGNFVLGSLPAASPSYAGSVIDLGNGVVQLQLTSGPLLDLSIRWTGATDNNWDTTTFNWLYSGNPSNFFAGSSPIFTDTASQSVVNLTTALSSGAITVSNNVLQYDFSGPGNIAGASSLIKKGTQTLTIDNQGVDVFGNVVVSGGTLQIGSGDVNGDISTLNITNNAAIVVNRSGAVALSAAISGAGSLTNSGPGTLTLSGESSYTGATVLNAGGLELDGTLSGGGSLATASGTLLSGSGTASGPVTVAGAINPGVVNAPGIFTASGAMTLSTGSTLAFDLSGSDPSTPSANDSITVGGNLSVNNNAITANFLGVPQVGSSYPLINYSGVLSGSFNPTVTGSHFTLALDTASTPGVVSLQVTGGSGANLKWTSTGDPSWGSGAPNWTDLNTSASSQFFSGDTVTFDDTPVVTFLTIDTGVSVYPSAITNISDNNSFTISGAGKISGTAGIVKGGNSTLTLATPNDFTGLVDIQGGILKVANNTALGSPSAGTTVESGATLDIGGLSLASEAITISGNGFNNAGAIINSGGTQGTAFRTLVLAGDASIGGTGQWSLNNAGGAATLSTGGQPFKLTKVGPNLIGLQNLSSVDPALGDIEIQQGTLEFNGLTPNMGDSSHTNIVAPGATLQFASDAVVWNKFFNFTGDGSVASLNNNTAANTELAGPVEVHGSVIFNVGGTSLTISSVISGDGSLRKSGSSPMILSGNNTYTGDTHINVGAMRLAGNGSISNTPNIVIAAGSTLTATGRIDTTFTLVNNQTLSGNGVLNGQLTTQQGATVSPGLSGIGGLTVSNAIALGGTCTMELDQDNATNDVLNCNSGITYGGILNLVNIDSPLTNGSSFKLFKALNYGGVFASIVPPTPGAGLAWNTNTLSAGIIGVVTGVASGPTTNASITSVKLSGTNIILHGINNNVPNTNFHYAVLISTNLALPLSNWTAVITNPFNGDGTFDYTNPIVTVTPRLFLDVKAVP
jgi:fibronectin-binding autotransporter adhesin